MLKKSQLVNNASDLLVRQPIKMLENHYLLHRLLLITIKRATMCMNQQRIKRRDMRVDGLVIELHATSIQYKNLNMPNHSLSCKCIQHPKNKLSIAWIWDPYKFRE